MTKQQATERAAACFQFNHSSQEWEFTPYRLVEALEYLGVLKLDAKSLHQRAIDIIERLCVLSPPDAAAVMEAIERAGLKIVEK